MWWIVEANIGRNKVMSHEVSQFSSEQNNIALNSQGSITPRKDRAMSKYTKGKLSVKKIGSKLFIIDDEGFVITKVRFSKKAEVNATELVRRWNAFEEDGLVGDYVDVCEYVHRLLTENTGQSTHAIAKLEAILWPKAKPE